MKKITLQTKCPCGNALKAEVKPPKFFSPTIAKLACGACDSRFIITNERELGSEGQKQMVSVVEILHLTEAAKDELSSRLSTKLKVAKDKIRDHLKLSKKSEPVTFKIVTELP